MRLGRAAIAAPVAASALLAAALTAGGSNPLPAHAQECPDSPALLGVLTELGDDSDMGVRIDVLPSTLDLSLGLTVPLGGDLPTAPWDEECPVTTATVAQPTQPAPSPPPPPEPSATSGTPLGPRSVT